MKKLSCLLLFLVVLFDFSACGEIGDGNGEKTTTTETVTNWSCEPKELSPFKRGEKGYRLVVLIDDTGEFGAAQPSERNAIPLEGSVPELRVGEKIFKDVKRYEETEDERVYLTKDENASITLYREMEGFRVYYDVEKRIPLAVFEGEALTEASLLAYVKDFVRSYLPNFDFEAHTYTFQTNGEAGFLTKEELGRDVTKYDLSFRIVVDGIPTGEGVFITLKPNGDIYRIIYQKLNVDWSQCEIDTEAAEAQIRSALHTSELSVKTVSNWNLSYENGKLQLVATAEVQHRDGWVALCLVGLC